MGRGGHWSREIDFRPVHLFILFITYYPLIIVKKNAPSPPASSSPGSPRVHIRAYNDDDEGSLEAPR